MDVMEAKEKLKDLENSLSRQLIAFERETNVQVINIAITRMTTINEHPTGPGYVTIRAEL